MPPPDKMYCAQQINIPPQLPDILKDFTKAAIRRQPKDLLQWSALYFNALSKGEKEVLLTLSKGEEEVLSAKDEQNPDKNIKFPTQKTANSLTPGQLKLLHTQLSPGQTCSEDDLQRKWRSLSLPTEQLETLLSLGSFSSEINWMEFFALGCSALGGTLMKAMEFACEILTDDKKDGTPTIPFNTFAQLYTYLAHLDGDVTQDGIDAVLSSLQERAKLQNGMITPLDFMHLDATK